MNKSYTFLIFLLFPILQLFAQSQFISGNVIAEEDNNNLDGVVIKLKNTNKAVVTNEKGFFTIKLTDDELKTGILVFSYTGFLKQEIRIGTKKVINVTLQRNLESLKEVVVTNSYSKPKRKEEVVGSIVTVNSAELQTTRPIESFDKMLEGLAAGVQVEQSSDLGTPVKINIRGQNSLSTLNRTNTTQLATSSQPLFIVDGVPIIEQRRGDESIAFLNNEQLLNPLAGINPDDIESISILKDAAAAAIYGANASNGVVIVTTKKGRAGKTRLNIGYSNGWAQSINKIKWLSGPQYYTLLKEMYINDGKAPFEAELLAGSSTTNTPWFELVNRYSTFNNVDVELSGGNENTTFRLSGSYYKQEAIQKGNDYSKIYFRLRVDHQINKKFLLSVTMAPSLTSKNALNVYSDVPIIPNAPSYNADGSFFKFSNLGVPNPLAVLAQNVNYHNGGSFNGNMRLEYQLKKNLRFSTTIGIDALQNKLNLFESPKNATGESKGGFARIYDRTNFGWISSTQVNWNPIYKEKNKFDFTLGFEAQEQSTKLLLGSGTGFTYYRLNELSNAANQSSASSKQNSTSMSVYSQLTYSYSDKYHVLFSGRYDAASVFGNDVNATVNTSLGLGWIISKEGWFKKTNWLDMLRLRVSYGSTGNSRIGSYQARGLYTFNNTGYNGGTGASPSSGPNSDLGWEKNFKRNIGIDFNFLKRYNFTLEFYQNILEDAISSVPIPAQNGFTTILANVGKMRNRGVDASLTAQIISNNKFKWTSTLNFGYNKNVILEIKNKTSLFGASTEGTVFKEGISTSAIWGFNFAGVDPQTGREMYYDKDGKIVSVFALDRNIATGGSYLGDRLPTAQGGLINAFNYKGISLTINILYSFGSKMLINYINENNGRNLSNRNQSVNLLDRWQKVGDVTNTPLLSASSNPLVYTASKYLYDNTYIKLSNVSLAYALPKEVTKKLKGIRLTVYGNATNLFYWYKQKSPENRNGIREYKFDFPESQTFTWGIKMNL